MTKVKSNRIFLGIVTVAMALAGTGLTIANNWENDVQIAAIAITLAACFTSAEASFLWGHKRFETATRLWRKIVLAASLVVLVGAMGFAVYEELRLALKKVANRGLASNSAVVVGATDKSNQRSVARAALRVIGEGKIESNPVPFVVCYIVTGLVSIAILAVTEKQRERTRGRGNLAENDPGLRARAAEQGFVGDDVKVYAAKGGGFAVWSKGSYLGHLKPDKMEKKQIGFMNSK